MTEVRDRRQIAATPREVWRILADVERYGRWAPWIHAVRRSERPTGLGLAYEERSRLLALRPVWTRWRVVEFDVPRRQVHRAEEVPLATSFERVFELAPDGDDGTLLTVTVRYEPAFGALGRLLDRAAFAAAQTRRLPPALERIELLARAPGPRGVP